MLTLESLCSQLSADPLRDTDAHPLVLYSLARFLPALKAVEIGVDDGSTTRPLLLGVSAVDGHLWSVDPAPCEATKAHIAESGYADRWTFENTTSSEFAARAPQPLDLVFIDGDHSFEGVARDWLDYEPLVRPDGLIVLHDALNKKEFPGISDLIDKHIRPFWERWECATLPWGWGLTIVRKVKI